MILCLVCIALLLAMAPLALVIRVRPLIYPVCAIISSALAVLALAFLAAVPQTLALPFGPFGGLAHLRLDALSAAFLVIINAAAAGASVYAIGYGQHEDEPSRVLPFFPFFIAIMNCVVLAADAYSFLFAWELMSLSSWALVMSRHREPATARAGTIYLVMAGFGTAALLLAFALLGGGSFVAMASHPLPPTMAAAVLALLLCGAGSKAGLAPLHVWLPLAHPAAPSHVSALMSGAMTKVAVYAAIRMLFDVMGPPVWWWSVPPLILGAITAALGVLQALMETDLKRILAYSTVDNIGIIFIALGLALAFKSAGLQAAAALALTAGVFHALNHMLFKSVLFFGAGTILVATGEAELDRLGGLIHRMPYSSAAFLAASLAIAALPPLNGFASEWLVFQSILVSPQLPQLGLKLLVPAVGVLLALAAALAAACFVRAFGISYLGRARSDAAAGAREADRWSVSAMVGFATLCLLTGVFPGAVIDALQPVAMALTQGTMPAQLGMPWLTIAPVSTGRSTYNGLVLFAFLGSAASLTALMVHRFGSRAVRIGPAWDCGTPGSDRLAQYSAVSLSQPIRRVFGSVIFAAKDVVVMASPGDTRPATQRRFTRDRVWDLVYAPIGRAVMAVSGWVNPAQFLSIRRYLAVVFVTLVALLIILAIWA